VTCLVPEDEENTKKNGSQLQRLMRNNFQLKNSLKARCYDFDRSTENSSKEVSVRGKSYRRKEKKEAHVPTTAAGDPKFPPEVKNYNGM